MGSLHFAAASSQVRRYFRLACSSLSNLLSRRFKSAIHPNKKSLRKGGLFYWLGWQDWVLPQAGPPRVVRFALLKIALTNYPLRTKQVLSATHNPIKKPPIKGGFFIGWGGRIRTYECRHQKPMPYHLATPQQVFAFGKAICRIKIFYLQELFLIFYIYAIS